MSAALPKAPEATMRVSALHGVGDLRLTERPVPVPGRGDVLVRVAAVGVCGSDTHYYTQGRIGPFVVDRPLVLGHESSVRIVGVGEAVDQRSLGSRVSIGPQRTFINCTQ